MPERKRVALYARVSTADQTAENQLLDLRDYCARRRWTIIEPPFVDAGISGAKEDRPALRQLMEVVSKRRMDIVLVWAFDRFARSTSHLVNTLEELRRRNIDFASYTNDIDTSTPQGKMVFTFLAAIAEFERSLIIGRIHAGLRRAKSEGKRFGRPRAIPESEITRIRAEAGKGSIRAIAARLGLSRSVVHRALSQNGIENVACAIDETDVALPYVPE